MKVSELNSMLDFLNPSNKENCNIAAANSDAINTEIENNSIQSIFQSSVLILNESMSECILPSYHPLVKNGDVKLLLQKFIYDNASFFQITDSLDECNTPFTKFTTGLYICTLEFYDSNYAKVFVDAEGECKCQRFSRMFLDWLMQHPAYRTNDPEVLLYVVFTCWSLNEHELANKYVIDYCTDILVHTLPQRDHSHARLGDKPVQVYYVQVIHTLQLLLYIGRLRMSVADPSSHPAGAGSHPHPGITDEGFIRHVILPACLLDKYVILLISIVVRCLLTFASLNFR